VFDLQPVVLYKSRSAALLRPGLLAGRPSETVAPRFLPCLPARIQPASNNERLATLLLQTLRRHPGSWIGQSEVATWSSRTPPTIPRQSGANPAQKADEIKAPPPNSNRTKRDYSYEHRKFHELL
jgi:hypothetical protein